MEEEIKKLQKQVKRLSWALVFMNIFIVLLWYELNHAITYTTREIQQDISEQNYKFYAFRQKVAEYTDDILNAIKQK